jgi:hypothetical protein
MPTRTYRRVTADDLNAMSDQQYRWMEDQQRARAARMGLQLRKARTRNTSAPEYGTYHIADVSTRGIVAGGQINRYGLGLDEVIAFLSERADS